MATRRQLAKLSQSRGANWQRQIEADATQAGLILHSVPAPTQILRVVAGKPQLRIARLETPKSPDYLGSFEGRSVAIEAKITSNGPSFPLDKRLQGHQGRALAQYDADGGIGAVVVCRLEPVTSRSVGVYVLPWPQCKPEMAKSIKWGLIEGYRVPVGVAWTDALAMWGLFCESEGW